MPIRRQPEPTPNGPNFGIVNPGRIIGPVQAAPFSQNASQTNNITNEAVDKARESIDDLRCRLEGMRGQYPEVDGALRDLDMIAPRLDEPDHDPGTMRYMLRCGSTCAVLGRRSASRVLSFEDEPK
jgi:hypothetical protein